LGETAVIISSMAAHCSAVALIYLQNYISYLRILSFVDWDGVASIAIIWGLDGPGFKSWQGKKFSVLQNS
jgi:hypothetical protein